MIVQKGKVVFMVRVRHLKKGEFFVVRDKSKHPNVQQVFIRGDYIPEEHLFECYDFDNCLCVVYFKPHQFVFTDFIL